MSKYNGRAEGIRKPKHSGVDPVKGVNFLLLLLPESSLSIERTPTSNSISVSSFNPTQVHRKIISYDTGINLVPKIVVKKLVNEFDRFTLVDIKDVKGK